MKIKSKAENIEAFRNGLFGNTLEVWDTPEDFYKSDELTATIRCKDARGGGGFCVYCVPKKDIFVECLALVANGAKMSDMWFHANPNPTGQTLQFEYIHRDDSGWITKPQMIYTKVNKPMRVAMQEESYNVSGHILCHEIIKAHMTDASYMAFLECLDNFPAHVFEVSCFGEQVGIRKGHNALIWEVRKY